MSSVAPRARSLAGRVIAITGGARGIGLATAQVLSQAGALVAIGDRDLELAQDALPSLGGKALALELDVTELSSVERFVDETEDRLRPLYGLINNAGINVLGSLVEADSRATDQQIDVNLRGAIHGVKAAGPRLKARGEGHIIFVASGAGKLAAPGAATYCATKHGLVGLSEALRGELRHHGVAVSAVFPHATETEMITGQRAVPGMPPIPPERVGRAIYSLLRRPRATAYVPAGHRLLYAVAPHVPAVFRDLAGSMFGSDRVFEFDSATRAEYHQRVLN